MIILLVVGFGVSAATVDSTTLNLGTKVDSVTSIIVGYSMFENPTDTVDFEGIVASGLAGTSENPLMLTTVGPEMIAIFTMTNVPGSYSVSTTAMPLKNADGYILPYSVKIGNASAVEVSTLAGANLTLIDTYTASGGMFFERSADIYLSVADDDFKAAQAGAYTSVWTINLIKN